MHASIVIQKLLINFNGPIYMSDSAVNTNDHYLEG